MGHDVGMMGTWVGKEGAWTGLDSWMDGAVVGNSWDAQLIVVEWRGGVVVLDARLPTSPMHPIEEIPTNSNQSYGRESFPGTHTHIYTHTLFPFQASCDSTGFCARRQDMAGKTFSRLLRQLTLR